MNYSEEKSLSEEFFKNCSELLIKKANDYAKDEDVFSNFKKIAQTVEIPAEKTFLVFMAVKIARVMELIKKEAKVDESISDSLQDIANYACLMSLYLKEKKQEVG